MAQAPFNYVVDQPDAASYFDAVRRGRADRQAVEQDQRNNALARYLPQALQGDDGARQQALTAGSPDQMIQLKQTFMQMDAPKLQAVKDLRAKGAAGATWAKTPEQWATVQATLRAEAQAAGLPFKEVPFEQKDAMAAMGQTVDSLIDQAYKEKMLANDTSRTTAQNAASYAQAEAARATAEATRRKPVGNIDPNTGVRIAPQGTQNKDVAQLQKYEQTADAFAGIATTLRGAQGAFDRVNTGPGTGIARMAASPFAMLGVESANQFVGDYDAIDAAAKESGIEKLKGIGGSDTERELLTAIQTGVNAETPSPENKRRIGNAIAAADIASQRHRLATEWFNKFGSLAYKAPNGMTWPQFWSSYQKQAWADHLRGANTTPPPAGGQRDYRGEQRQLLNGTAPQGVPPPPPGFEVR